MSGYADSEKIQYALKTALYRTMQTSMSDSASVERSAPLRVFPTNIMKVNIIEAGKGDIGEDGTYVTGHATAGQTADLLDPESTVKNYKIICPVNNVITNITISALVGYGSQTKAQIDALPTSGQTYPLKQWFFRGHYSGSGEAAFNAANVTYDGLQLAWNSTTNNTTPSEADTVPHLKYYLQVQTNYTGVSHSSSADNITYEHSLLKGLIGLDSNFVSTIMVTQGEGGPSSSASLGTSGSQAGDFWFTQPTAGILSFYGVTNKVDASTDLATFNTKYPMISYVRYTGETGFGAGSGGGGGAAADPQQSLTEEPSWSSDSMTTRFIDGVIIASTEMDSNTDSRPAIATRNSSTSIKDYEISAIPYHYTNFVDNYGWDHGFLRIRAGGGTNTNQTSYIDLTGYSQNADMTRNIVFGTAGTERMRISSSGNVGIGTTSPTLGRLQINSTSVCGIYLMGDYTDYNYILNAPRPGNTAGGAVHFINHASRTGDGGQSCYTIRNDSGPIRLGQENQITTIEGSDVILDGNVGIGETSPGAPLHIKFTQSGDPTNNIKDMIKLETQYSTDFSGSYREGGSSILFYVENTTNQGLPGEAARIVAGCYESSSNTEYHSYLAFHTSNNGSPTGTNERMVIDDNGYVGIGTTNPHFDLDIGADSGGWLSVRTDSVSNPGKFGYGMGFWNASSHYGLCFNAGGNYKMSDQGHTPQLFISAHNSNGSAVGNVGIGTATPDQKLHISNSGNTTLKIVSLNTMSPGIELVRTQTAYTGGHHASSVYADDAWTDWKIFNDGSYLKFQAGYRTATSGNHLSTSPQTLVTAMTLDQDGNVGIGTTSPDAPLQISGQDMKEGLRITRTNTTSSGSYGPYILLHNEIWGGRSVWGNYDSNNTKFGPLSNNSLEIITNATTRMTINHGGNVGIGITDPASPLEIQCTAGGNSHNTQWTGAKGLRLTRTVDGYAWEIVNGYHNDLLFRNMKADGTIYRDNVLMLDDNGNVGIGTNSPGSILHLKSNGCILNMETTQGNVNGRSCYISFRDSDSNNGGEFFWLGDGSSGNKVIHLYSSRGDPIVLDNANVGIGTTSPLCGLQVGAEGEDSLKSSMKFSRFMGAGYRNHFPAGAYSGFSCDNHGTFVMGNNCHIKYNGEMTITNTHTTMAGVAICMPGNSQVGQGSILFYTKQPASVTRGDVAYDIDNGDTSGSGPTLRIDGIGRITHNCNDQYLMCWNRPNHSMWWTRIDGSGLYFHRNGIGDCGYFYADAGNSALVLNRSINNNYARFQTNYSSWNGKLLVGAGPMGNGSGQNNWVSSYACVFCTSLNLHLDSGSGHTIYLNYYTDGNIWIDGSVRYTSDDRLKHNEKKVVNALDVINKLDVLTYFKSKNKYAKNHNYELDESGNPITDDKYHIETGLIAQKVKEIPELEYCVTYTDPIYEDDEHGDYAVSYNDIFCFNITATQELDRQQQADKAKINELENKVATLESELAAIKQHLGI